MSDIKWWTEPVSNDARQAIHDWRWGPYIDDPIERQEVVDAMIATIMDAFNQLEARLASARAIMQKFVDKVDRGMARSVETYAEMKEWLDE